MSEDVIQVYGHDLVKDIIGQWSFAELAFAAMTGGTRPTAHQARMTSADGAAPGFAMPDGRVKVPAAWLIERSGFSKGYVTGPVGLSSKHPLAIVNRGGATARDVVGLARCIQQQVADQAVG